MSEIKLSVTAEGNEVIVRQGEAPKPQNPEAFKTAGNINAVFDYLRVRNPDKNTAIILANTQARTITLITDEHAQVKSTIHAALTMHPIFEALGINTGKEHTPATLGKALRENKYYFPTDDVNQIVANLRNLSVKIEGETQKTDDNRGNKSASIAKRVTAENVPQTLTIRAPIFIGDEESNIPVEILIDTLDVHVKLFLESPDLIHLAEVNAKKHFETNIDDFRARGYAVIIS